MADLSPAERRAIQALAAKVSRTEKQFTALSRAQQIAHSTVTVPDGSGTTEMLVPEAVGRGVQAGFDAKAVDEKLDTARAELEQAQAELDDKLADAELGLEGANERLNDAEDAIGDAFLSIGDVQLDLDAVRAVAPELMKDPMFRDGFTSWSGSGGGFYFTPEQQEQQNQNWLLLGARTEGGIHFVAETVNRSGLTNAKLVLDATIEATVVVASLSGSLSLTLKTNVTSQASDTVTVSAPGTYRLRITGETTVVGAVSLNVSMTTNGTDEFAIIQRTSLIDVTAAADAQATANAALVSANGKQNIYRDTGDPSGSAPEGSVWFKVDSSGAVVGQYQFVDGSWVETPVTSDVISNLDVGKLTAGGAVIAELVAQEIASATAEFQRADIKNLFVTAGATINEAVIDKLWADVVVAKMLVADKIISSEAIVDELVGKVITAVTVNGGTINGVTMVAGEFTTEADFDPDTTTYGVYINSQKGMIANGVLGYVIGGTTYDVRAQSKTQAATSRFTIDAKKAHELAGDTSVTTAETSGMLNALGLTLNNYAANVNNSVIEQQDVFLYSDRLEMRSVGSGNNNIPHGGAWLEPGMLRIDGGDGGRPGDSNKTFVHSDSIRFTSYQQTERRLDASVDNRLALVAPRIDLNAGNGLYVNGQLLGDTGWINLAYASGFTDATAGQIGYRVKNGIVFIRGGAAGTISEGVYQVVTSTPIPIQYRPAQHYRTGGMGSSMRGNVGIEINSSDGLIRLGWNGGTRPAWFGAGCSYPVD